MLLITEWRAWRTESIIEGGVYLLGHVALREDLLDVGGVLGEVPRSAQKAHVGVGDDHRVSEDRGGAFGELRQVVGGQERLEHAVAPELEHGGLGRQVEEGGAEVLVARPRGDEHEVAGDARPGGYLRAREHEHDVARSGLDRALLELGEAAHAHKARLGRDARVVLRGKKDILVEQFLFACAPVRAGELVQDRP